MKVSIIKANEPTLNGHLYTEEICETIADAINSGKTDILETRDIGFTKDFFQNIPESANKFGFAKNAEVIDGEVIVEIELNGSVTDHSLFTPSGVGVVGSDNEFDEYEFCFIQHSVQSSVPSE